MSTHNMCFCEEMAKIIFQLSSKSSNTHFICSSDVMRNRNVRDIEDYTQVVIKCEIC